MSSLINVLFFIPLYCTIITSEAQPCLTQPGWLPVWWGLRSLNSVPSWHHVIASSYFTFFFFFALNCPVFCCTVFAMCGVIECFERCLQIKCIIRARAGNLQGPYCNHNDSSSFFFPWSKMIAFFTAWTYPKTLMANNFVAHSKIIYPRVQWIVLNLVV